VAVGITTYKNKQTSEEGECHVASVTDPYGRILGYLDRTCCVNPIDNTHYVRLQNVAEILRWFKYSRAIGCVKAELRIAVSGDLQQQDARSEWICC
jgi:hypothetical protein